MTPRPVRVHGQTPEERAASRAKRTSKRRAQYFTDQICATRDQRERLAHACRYLRAMAKHLTDAQIKKLAGDVVRLAQRAEKEGTQP